VEGRPDAVCLRGASRKGSQRPSAYASSAAVA
jgi:hypothetical protein